MLPNYIGVLLFITLLSMIMGVFVCIACTEIRKKKKDRLNRKIEEVGMFSIIQNRENRAIEIETGAYRIVAAFDSVHKYSYCDINYTFKTKTPIVELSIYDNIYHELIFNASGVQPAELMKVISVLENTPKIKVSEELKSLFVDKNPYVYKES